jgi:hypothetical protein
MADLKKTSSREYFVRSMSNAAPFEAPYIGTGPDGEPVPQTALAIDHELKCWPPYYNAVLDGTKTFELRKDDRGFRIGDTVLLREWSIENEYTGRQCLRTVVYIASGAAMANFGLERGYVILGIKPFEVVHG